MEPSIKKIFFFSLFLFLSTNVVALDDCYKVLNKHSFVLPNGKFQIKSAYLKVNDTLDIFNIKEQELGSSLNSHETIGDMDGYDIEARYGISKTDSIFINYQRWNIKYYYSTLINNKIDFFNKYNIYSNKHSFFSNISLDIGYERNKATPIYIKSDQLINSIIKKIKPNTSISINDGNIISGNMTLSLYDLFGNKIYPYLSIENLKSNSYYTRILVGKKILKNLYLDFYMTYKYLDIKTKISFYPDNNKFINNAMGDFKIENLNRKESVVNVGFVYMQKLNIFTSEINYEYNKIFRDKELSGIDVNQVLNISLSQVVNDNILIYIGAKLMSNQFSTDLTYLYNNYTKNQFDKKYGFAKFGFIFSY